MGARQSKRSVDITTTPKKGEIGEVAVEGEGKVEKIVEIDAKITTNGTLHTDSIEYADKDETGDEVEDGNIKENGVNESENDKNPSPIKETSSTTATAGESNAAGDQQPTLNEKSTETPVEEKTTTSTETPTTDSKKVKEKKKNKKWSFRSLSFTKKDKSKPSKDAEKNGEVKEVTEEATEDSPASETPKSDEQKTPDSLVPNDAAIPETNGDATSEEKAKVVNDETPQTTKDIVEPIKQIDISKTIVEETKPSNAPETQPPPAESVPSPVVTSTIGDVKKSEESITTTISTTAPKTIEESKSTVESTTTTTTSVVEEVNKEVRNEEVPPPLPTSNPPSPVTVFAESTKADALSISIIAQNNPPQSQSPHSTDSSSFIVNDKKCDDDVKLINDKVIVDVVESCPLPSSIINDTTNSSVILKSDNIIEPTTLITTNIAIVDDKTPIIIDNTNIITKSEPEQKTHIQPVTDNIVKPLVDESSDLKNQIPQTELNIKPDLIPIETKLLNTDSILEKKSDEQKTMNDIISSESLQIDKISKSIERNIQEIVNESSSSLLLNTNNENDLNKTTTIITSPQSPENDVIVDNSVKETLQQLQSSPISPPPETEIPEMISLSEPVANADSLPDVSTESLPSLPEPISECGLLSEQPMSLPPVDSVPEPLTTTIQNNDNINKIETIQTSHVVNDNPSPLPKNDNNEMVVPLTNGNATTNGLPSPIDADVVQPPPPSEGPLKQVHTDNNVGENISEPTGDVSIKDVTPA